MKRLILFFTTAFCLFFATACTNTKYEINYKEDKVHQVTSNYTYRFVGESKHFYFETGKVYYDNAERELLISNFKVKDNINKDAKFSINLYFDDKILYGNVSHSNQLLTKKEFEDIVIGEYGTLK